MNASTPTRSRIFAGEEAIDRSRKRGNPLRYSRALSAPCRRASSVGSRAPPPDMCVCSCQEEASIGASVGRVWGLTGGFFDAVRFTHLVPGLPTPRRVAVVGGGPAGLTAAVSMLNSISRAAGPMPELVLVIFEKRPEPLRRQRVFLDFGRLQGGAEGADALHVLRPRLEALLSARGASASTPGTALEIRTLEDSLWQLLREVATAARGRAAVRLEHRTFGHADLLHFDHVIGADGRRSAVRQMLMARIPRVRLTQCALTVEFAYNCHLEWQAEEHLHVLKAHRYENWKPVLLYQHGADLPEYVELCRADFDAVQRMFARLLDTGQSPYITPFTSANAFLDVFDDDPSVKAALREALEAIVGFNAHAPAIIAPVDNTLHRAPHLVAPAKPASATTSPALWLLGDAAVGLPVSKGCNLAYHMAAAGRLALALPANHFAEYEDFVFKAWHHEAWKDGRGLLTDRWPAGCPRKSGRFTG